MPVDGAARAGANPCQKPRRAIGAQRCSKIILEIIIGPAALEGFVKPAVYRALGKNHFINGMLSVIYWDPFSVRPADPRIHDSR